MNEGSKGKNLNKRLIGALIIIILIIIGSAIAFSNWNAPASDNINQITGNSSNTNQSINSTNTTGKNKTSPSGKNQTNTIILIDSGNSYGHDDYYWNSNYTNSWKTYAQGTNKVVIYAKWTFTDAKKVIKQTITIREDPDNVGMAFVDIVPKMSGKSDWETWTSLQGNKNAVKFYWNSFRKSGLKDGYWS